MDLISRRHVFGMAGALGFGATAPRAIASPMTSRPSRMIVGFAPGGSVDTLARLLVDQMRSEAPSLVVENRPGAGGRIAIEALRASPADGSTLLLTPSDPITFAPYVNKTTPYNVHRDFIPIAMIATAPFLFSIGPRVPRDVDTIESFAAFCRADPAAAVFGSPGAGSRPHFIGAMLARTVGFPFVHVPYSGAAPAVQDLLSGQIAATVMTISNVQSHIQAGTVRALASTGPKRSAALLGARTIRETGYPGLEAVEWFAVVAPPGTSADALRQAESAVHLARQAERVRETLTRLSFDPASDAPGDIAEEVQADIRRWEATIQASGFTP